MFSHNKERINWEVYEKYKPAINYLQATGEDYLVVKPVSENVGGYDELKDVLSEANVRTFYQKFPMPLTIGEDTLDESFMKIFGIYTLKDCAKYIRIISILLTNYTGPKEYDTLKVHLIRLHKLFKDKLTSFEVAKAFKVALWTYEISTNEHYYKILEEKHYNTFTRILCKQFKFYKVYDAPTAEDFDERAELHFGNMNDKILVEILGKTDKRKILHELLIKHNIATFDSAEKMKDLVDNPQARETLLGKIRTWYSEVATKESLKKSFMNIFGRSFTEEKLYEMIKNERRRGILLTFIKHFDNRSVTTDKELYRYVTAAYREKRQQLYQRIKAWHERESKLKEAKK